MSEQHCSKSAGKNPIDMTGKTYGKLKVISYAGYLPGTRVRGWHCVCECGTECIVNGGHLRFGLKKSCGCLYHYESKTRLYRVWAGMKSRCQSKCMGAYKYYGDRGITVCEEWKDDFPAFKAWAMGNGYSEGLSIERKDVNGPYSPQNCCWIPIADQALNTRNTVRVTAFGETHPLTVWAKDSRCVVPRHTLDRRIKQGWDHEKAILTPQRVVHQLTRLDIPEIRAMLASGCLMKDVARKFHVSLSTIMDVKAGRSWSHV